MSLSKPGLVLAEGEYSLTEEAKNAKKLFVQADWREWLQSNPEDILLAAVTDKDQVIGYALTRVKADIYPGYAAEIMAMHITQYRQGQGVGGALLEHTVAELQKRGCPSVMLWTLKQNSTRNWYEKLGAIRLGEKRVQIEDRVIVEIAYGWDTLSALLPNQTGKHNKSDITGG